MTAFMTAPTRIPTANLGLHKPKKGFPHKSLSTQGLRPKKKPGDTGKR